LDLWGVQVSGSSPNAVSRAVAEISTLVGARRVAIHDAVQTILDAAALVRPDDRFSKAMTDKEQLGYEIALTPGRVQGLFDALLFLTAAQDPAATVQSLASRLQSVTHGCAWLTEEQKDRSFERFLTSLGGAYDASAHRWIAVRSGMTTNRARIAFLQYAIASRAVQETPELSAEEFMASASALDEVVRTCLRALHDDVQNLYLDPLLEDLRVLARSSGSRVVGLVGNTSITTLDGSSATVSGKAMSYFDITPPTSLKEALETAEALQPQIAEYLKGTDTATSSQASTTGEVIQAASGELSVAQKLAVLMAASQQRGQVWSELEDGISLTVTPHVGPNGDAAELSLYAKVSREAPRVSGSADSAAKDPLNRIADHTIGKSETEQVEFRVQSLDLFPVSTFSVQTSHRRPDAEIPILGQIPYLGQIFRFKRSPAVVHHQSVLLISSTILPGASELGRLHPKGSGFSVKAFPGIPTTEGGDKKARELISEYERKTPVADSGGSQ
ncbi:type II and III secretion system protein, partial [bacterium]|nr:type II and III secretion system protein [bacterium]